MSDRSREQAEAAVASNADLKGSTSLIEALRARVASLAASGVDVAQLPPEQALQRIVRSHATTEAEIRFRLTPATRRFAADLARAVAAFSESNSLSQAAAESEPSQTSTSVRTPQPGARAQNQPRIGEGEAEEARPDAEVIVDVHEPTGPLAERSDLPFARFAFAAQDTPASRLRFGFDTEGRLLLAWDEQAGSDVVIYRVIARDDRAPHSPDAGETVAVTRGANVVDERPFSRAVRYIQVWAHRGRTRDEALASQPTLHASDSVVTHPTGVEIREDNGRVIGQWDSLDGASAVHVYRVPAQRAQFERLAAQHRILEGSANRSGFVDTGVERGGEYLYQVRTQCDVDGHTRLSDPVDVELRLSQVLRRVSDLSVVADKEVEGDVVLSWTPPPGGTVWIYRTPHPPAEGSDNAEVHVTSLTQMNLSDDSRLRQNPERDTQTGRAVMRGVSRPHDWTRTYFTPVTVQGERAFIGAHVSHVFVEGIANAKLVERVDKEVLTFDWPAGVSVVRIYQAPKGTPPEQATQQRPEAEVAQDAYLASGGYVFNRPLPVRGCDVFIVPVSFQAGRQVEGKPRVVTQEWLARMRYAVKLETNVLRRVTGATVTVVADDPIKTAPDFVLVYNPDRLPLHVEDGRAVMMVRADEEAPTPSRTIRFGAIGPQPAPSWRAHPGTWKNEIGDRPTGYLRMFANVPPELQRHLAVMDPAVDRLALGRGGR
ncbi:hypothetical protein [Demequina rhizosphaerae]|uniref:hypothetical protein n=1 Tax=Demequina rhizosphaerae TaxID=1638985 RepID=UPI0007848665|nr:hypothetical protein [Demequina rhizosphaerae]